MTLGARRRVATTGLILRRTLAGMVTVLSLAAASFADGQQRPGTSPAPPSTDGIVVERIRLPRAPAVQAGDQMLTLVRVDLARFRLAVRSSVRDGRPRPMNRWIETTHLAGGINAGMFLPNRRPVGTLIDRDEVLSDRNPGRMNAIVGWDPRGSGSPIAVGGAGCPSSRAQITRRYHSVVQGFRMMVDCRGRAVRWPNRRRYSAAGFGRDREGRAVFLHVRTPYRMAVLNQMLVDLDLGLAGIVYMEGGPEASLVVRHGAHRVTEIGSWEDDFWENDSNAELWSIPSVIGFEPRP